MLNPADLSPEQLYCLQSETWADGARAELKVIQEILKDREQENLQERAEISTNIIKKGNKLTESAGTSEKTYRDGLADVAGIIFEVLHEYQETLDTVAVIMQIDAENTPHESVKTLKHMSGLIRHLHDRFEDDYFVILDDLKKEQRLADMQRDFE